MTADFGDPPTIGVEEEFLLVDPDTGAPVALNTEVAQNAAEQGVDLQMELTTCQVETATDVLRTPGEVHDAITRLRRISAAAAEKANARLLAVALPPTVPHEFPITDKPRYRRIAADFGMIAHEQGISGCHVHVAVPDRDTAVRVCTRLRPWLPLLLALSANSAIYRNADTGYASWRHILWNRWPSAGPPPHLHSAAEFDTVVAEMQDSGTIVDDGMVYWDARPSAKFPTVEIRAADVSATAADATLLAVLIRAAVMTALRLPDLDRVTSDHVLRAAYWRCARDGTQGKMPVLLTAFVDELRPALEAAGDYDYASAELQRVLRDGNGAARQRRAWQRRNSIDDVLAEVAAATVS
ncbi:carboxylate--amine ligase [Mycobacterium sp. MS1601]|uniref:glutamate--cysteine ligase n=1 Tax=Mycobacterium sp. MS1601 TaxID=1936029 RepID=UPI000979848B|nr:glutamate--cysteine ligase [Mycobacterium sp. MS1601]AQA02214.1 carboxylate--amine ligase [Mycobacterium sp. MS1601]